MSSREFPDQTPSEEQLFEMADGWIRVAKGEHESFANNITTWWRSTGETSLSLRERFPNTIFTVPPEVGELSTVLRYTTAILDEPISHELLEKPDPFFLDEVVGNIFMAAHGLSPQIVRGERVFEYRQRIDIDAATKHFAAIRTSGLGSAVQEAGRVTLYRPSDVLPATTVDLYRTTNDAVQVGFTTETEIVGEPTAAADELLDLMT